VAGSAAIVFLLFYLLSGGRAMGLGDTPVALGLSLLVGPEAVLPGVLFSFWIGALYGIMVLVTTKPGHRMGMEVPFVPFLALGFLLAYFTGWNPLPIF
jgi:leader peptidase (prepilin peptidase) / N-methyltransferase